MSQKDFLSQFSNENKKPESFKEEVRIPVKKEKKPVNKGLIIGAVALLIVLVIASYFIFFAPKIAVPNFMGSSKSDVAAWVKQQGIDPTGIVFKETYDFDTQKDIILYQDIESGKKVTKKAKITFTLSMGADPDEKITVPDLMNMSKADIQKWANDNKLTSVRFVSTYSDKIDEGYVIKTSKFNEDEFKRSTSLEVTISKGPQPAGVVRMEDFVGKAYEEAEYWAKTNKIEIHKAEQYSDSVDMGKIISQNVSKDTEIKQGDSFRVVVSLGKAVYMPNMTGWSESDINMWCSQNGVISRELDSVYSNTAKGKCLEYSPAAGRLLSANDKVEYRISLGNSIKPMSSDEDGFEDEILEANRHGAGIRFDVERVFSDDYSVGRIIFAPETINIQQTVTITVSRGRNILLSNPSVPDFWQKTEGGNYTEGDFRDMLDDVQRRGNVIYKYQESEYDVGKVIKVVRSDTNGPLVDNTYLPDDVMLTVYVCDVQITSETE